MDQLVVDLREGDAVIHWLLQVRERNVVFRETLHPLLDGLLRFRALEEARRREKLTTGGMRAAQVEATCTSFSIQCTRGVL